MIKYFLFFSSLIISIPVFSQNNLSIEQNNILNLEQKGKVLVLAVKYENNILIGCCSAVWTFTPEVSGTYFIDVSNNSDEMDIDIISEDDKDHDTFFVEKDSNSYSVMEIYMRKEVKYKILPMSWDDSPDIFYDIMLTQEK